MFKVGDIIKDRYELLNFIAHGGMGEVWECMDNYLKRVVAIKFVRGILTTDSKSYKILKDEASTGANLVGHPNVVTVLDFDKIEYGGLEVYYIVMEYVDGKNLTDWIEDYKDKVDPNTYYLISLLITWDLCKAIDYAHKKGIIHRDIKPLNLFISKYGITKVGDFGIAKFVDEVTRTHTVWQSKSPLYTAPEQWRGEKPDEKTDLYQLGCTIYELFTGVVPFQKDNAYALMNAHLNETPKSPSELNGQIPEELSKMIIDFLSKNPDDRPDLWQLNDAIASEIQSTYTLHLEVKNVTDEIKEQIDKITDIDFQGRESANINFPDFYEVLSEGIQLLLMNHFNFKISKIEAEEALEII